MSYTELFYFNKKGEANKLSTHQNAWRGAMAVWKLMEDKYLPPYIPDWARAIGDPGQTYSRTASMFGDDMAIKEIWQLADKDDVSMEDKIVLCTTFDKAIVKKENLPQTIEAFRVFNKANQGITSIGAQAYALEKAHKDPDCIAVAWNQTSACSAWVFSYDDDHELIKYNVLTDAEHWEVFESLK